MMINPLEQQITTPKKAVIKWLLDSDPAIRWQVMRDLTKEPDELVVAERQRVATEGWGAQMLALQGPDGKWGGDTFPAKWASTFYALLLLRDMGLDPTSEQARKAVDLVRRKVTWGQEHGTLHSSRVRSNPVSMEGFLRWVPTSAGRAIDWLTGSSASSLMMEVGIAKPHQVGDPHFTLPSVFWKDC